MADAALSPAERYAAARALQSLPRLRAFRDGLTIELDPFQQAACAALMASGTRPAQLRCISSNAA